MLDEPNANLDAIGERALSEAVKAAAAQGAAVVVVTHRPALLEAASRIAVLQDGKIVKDGPRSEVLRPVAVQGGQRRQSPALASEPSPAPQTAAKAVRPSQAQSAAQSAAPSGAQPTAQPAAPQSIWSF